MLTKPSALAWFCAVLAAGSSCVAQTPFPMSNPVVGLTPSFGTLPGRPLAGDLNSDGREDIVGVGAPNTVSLLLTSPGGGYNASTPMVVVPVQSTITGAQAVGDLTFDGAADVLLSIGSPFPPFSPPAQTLLYPGFGNGTFGIPIPLPAGAATNAASHTCFVAPHIPGVTFPGGPPAIVLFALQQQVNQPGMIFVFSYASGAYTVASSMIAPSIPALRGAGIYAMRGAGDCDGDGLLDLIGLGGPLGLPTNVVLFKGISTSPYFAAPVAGPTPIAVQNSPGIVVEDVTNDGRADIVAVKNPTSGTTSTEIVVFPGHATAPFATFVVSNIGVPVYQMWTNDLDDDGAVDLFVVTAPPQGSTVYGFAICRGNGLGGFQAAMTLAASASTSSNLFAFADEDGDGRRDAVGCANSGGNTFILYDQTRIGPGVPGQSTLAPATRMGIASPGNALFFVGVTGGAPNAAAIVGVSLGLLPGPDALGNLLNLDPGVLLVPSGATGFFQTDAAGTATWAVALPPAPAFVGATVFLEWAVADAFQPTGWSLTPARKIVVW